MDEQIKKNKCLRCGHKWIPRGNTLACPKCKRYDWNIKTKRKFASTKKEESK